VNSHLGPVSDLIQHPIWIQIHRKVHQMRACRQRQVKHFEILQGEQIPLERGLRPRMPNLERQVVENPVGGFRADPLIRPLARGIVGIQEHRDQRRPVVFQAQGGVAAVGENHWVWRGVDAQTNA